MVKIYLKTHNKRKLGYRHPSKNRVETMISYENKQQRKGCAAVLRKEVLKKAHINHVRHIISLRRRKRLKNKMTPGSVPRDNQYNK